MAGQSERNEEPTRNQELRGIQREAGFHFKLVHYGDMSSTSTQCCVKKFNTIEIAIKLQ